MPDPKLTRHYYIAAEPVMWNFIPLRSDPTCSITGGEPAQRMTVPPALLQHPISRKLRYLQYTDDQFNVRANQLERLGILGPVLRGLVGEYLAVTFLNRSDRPLSIHSHGVKYDKDSEGAAYLPNPGLGARVVPGAKFTYVWKLDESSGPRPTEPSSKAWLYHSHVMAEQDVNLGLVGFIIVTDPTRARADGTPQDVDREMAVFLNIFDESGEDQEEDEEAALNPESLKSLPLEARILNFANSIQALKRRENGERHTINGFTYANLPGLEMRENERVRWYLFGLGSERDLHTVHWHGSRVIENGDRRTDVIELLPGSMKIADMVADNPGTWLLQCHVGEHMTHGMFCTYTVHSANATAHPISDAFFPPGNSPESISIKSAKKLPVKEGATDRRLLNLTGELSLNHLPPFEGSIVAVQLGRERVTFHLKSDGKGEFDGNQIDFRIIRTGGGMLGATLGFNLNLILGAEKLDNNPTILSELKPLNVPLRLRINGLTATGTVSL
ncbi:MAG: multicopper oxidase domain-containing protein [Verrucomicrobiota bacterium]